MWNERSIEEMLAIPIRNGLTKPQSVRGQGVKMIGMGELFANRRIGNIPMPLVPTTEKELSSSLVKEGDLLFARQSLVLEGAGKCSIVKEASEPTVFESHLIRMRLNPDIMLPQFMFYFFESSYGKSKMMSIVEQVAAAGIRGKDLTKLCIPCPSIDAQREATRVLSLIDDKIDVDSEINRLLYNQLKLMFAHDYFDAIENNPDWPEVTLDDVTSKFATGLNPRKNFVLGHGENYYVTIKNMGDNRIYLDEKCDKVDDEALTKINKRSDLQVGDLLFSGIGTIGRVHLIDSPATNWNISESVFTMRPNEKVTSVFLFLLLLSDSMQDYALTQASGSVQKGIRMADLKRYTFRLPNHGIMNAMSSSWLKLVTKIKENEKEIDHLVQIRHELVEQIMSGGGA